MKEHMVAIPRDVDGKPLKVGDFVWLSDSDDYDIQGIILTIKLDDYWLAGVVIPFEIKYPNNKQPAFEVYGWEKCKNLKKATGDISLYFD